MTTVLNQRWNEFIELWPLSRVKEMTIEEYTQAGSKDTFTYWLEARLDGLGSIRGGSAFKFGIFNRKDRSARTNTNFSMYTDEYGWHPKYGDTPEAAFIQVRELIVEVIDACQANRLEKIDAIDLGDAYKWKIAFHYQNRDKPAIAPVFSRKMLEKLAKVEGKLKISHLQRTLVDRKPSELDLLEYGKRLWEAFNDIVAKEGIAYWIYSPGETAKYWDEFYNDGIMALGWDELDDLSTYEDKTAIVQALQEFEKSKSSKKNDATANYQFCNEMKPGDVIIVKKGQTAYVGAGYVDGEYEYDRERDYYKHIRKMKWVKKGEWEHDEKVALKTLTNVTQDAEYVKRVVKLIGLDDVGPASLSKNEQKAVLHPLNTILYGPPGTGKTYELLNHWIPSYTSVKQTQTEKQEDAIRAFVADAAWWEVIAYVIADSKSPAVTVREISNHPVLQMKASLSNNKNLNAALWRNLQAHTNLDSQTVNCAQRQAPAVFDKNSDSTWHLLHSWQEIAPDLAETIGGLQGDTSDTAETVKRYEFVTFHQSYGYEEFIEGLRPNVNDDGQISYDVRPGVFQRICNRAKLDPANRYAIFIDEINRGNISKIFGELITLIEKDKRVSYTSEGKPVEGDKGLQVTLPYSGTKFGVPANLDIVGTMNTADRSIALLDIALRRRFAFKEIMPQPEIIPGADGNGTIEDGAIDLRAMLQMLNRRIRLLANRELQLGHAFFCPVKTKDDLNNCFLNKIIPLLQEYFYGHWERVQLVLGDSPEQLTTEQKKQKAACCFILSETLDETLVLGIDHDDYESRPDYTVNSGLSTGQLSNEAYTKIYQVKDASSSGS